MRTHDDVTFVLNREGRVCAWSPGAERLYGYSAADALSMAIERLVPAEDLVQMCELLDASKNGGGVAQSLASRITREGRVVAVMTTAVRFVDDAGRPAGVVNVDHPISDTRELGRMAHLEAEVARRDECLSIVSHELRGSLTVLTLTLDGLLRLDRNSRELDRRLELARRQTARMSRLLGQLFDVSELTQGAALPLEREQVDLVEVAKDLIDRMGDVSRRARSAVHVRATPPVRGFWDRQRIEQVLENLLANALKFAAGKPVELALSADRHQATLRVRDHGPGIPEADRERVFERFVRRAPKEVAGLGLGLYIVRSIVEGHGGRIHVESGPDEGAEFVVTLPLDRSPTKPAPP
jgi:PAS domain S-box-containing protein